MEDGKEGRFQGHHCYCQTSELEQNMLLCKICKNSYHPGCLKSGRPSNLVGDVYFKFVCATCSSTGEEHCERIKLQWTIVVILSLYNLQLQGGGKCGYFRWREHICNFIDRHWTVFFGQHKKKTATWHGTVAGTLSSGCPTSFISGMESLGESGWWSLKTTQLPALEEVETMVTTHKSGKRSKGNSLPVPFPLVDGLRRRKSNTRAAVALKEEITQGSKRFKASKEEKVCKMEKRESLIKNFDSENRTSETEDEINEDIVQHDSQICDREFSAKLDVTVATDVTSVSNTAKSMPLEFKSVENDLVFEWLKQDSENNEEFGIMDISMDDCSSYDINIPEFDVLDAVVSEALDDVKCNSEESPGESEDENNHPQESVPNAKKLQASETGRKRKAVIKDEPPVHQQQNPPQFTLMSPREEQQMLKQLENVEKMVDNIPEARRLRRKLIVRQLKRGRNIPVFDLESEIRKLCGKEFPESNERLDLESTSNFQNNILDRHQVDYFNVVGRPYRQTTFVSRPMGQDDDYGECFISPYTSRLLKPIIWQDYKVLPLKLRLLREIVAFHHRNDSSWKAPPRYPIDYCYVRPNHIPMVNALCQEFFWPGIDLSECLQYPDFSCVAFYRKLMIGFAFMVPDVNYKEALYLTYMFTHPEWQQNGGIASFMLYHLIQTCVGKDITVHVAMNDPALSLYKKFGFKIEKFVLNFYDKYLPSASQGCHNALFLRLRS